MQEKNISTGIHYPIALPHLKAYRYLNYGANDFSVALKCSQDILSLPIYPELREEQVEYICEQLTIALKR
jgi:dTDP-4-amino-4,6-dideoxygalactose transaminase